MEQVAFVRGLAEAECADHDAQIPCDADSRCKWVPWRRLCLPKEVVPQLGYWYDSPKAKEAVARSLEARTRRREGLQPTQILNKLIARCDVPSRAEDPKECETDARCAWLAGYQVCVPKQMVSEFRFGSSLNPLYSFNTERANAFLRSKGKADYTLLTLARNAVGDWWSRVGRRGVDLVSRTAETLVRRFLGDMTWVEAVIEGVLALLVGTTLAATAGVTTAVIAVAAGVLFGASVQSGIEQFERALQPLWANLSKPAPQIEVSSAATFLYYAAVPVVVAALAALAYFVGPALVAAGSSVAAVGSILGVQGAGLLLSTSLVTKLTIAGVGIFGVKELIVQLYKRLGGELGMTIRDALIRMVTDGLWFLMTAPFRASVGLIRMAWQSLLRVLQLVAGAKRT